MSQNGFTEKSSRFKSFAPALIMKSFFLLLMLSLSAFPTELAQGILFVVKGAFSHITESIAICSSCAAHSVGSLWASWNKKAYTGCSTGKLYLSEYSHACVSIMSEAGDRIRRILAGFVSYAADMSQGTVFRTWFRLQLWASSLLHSFRRFLRQCGLLSLSACSLSNRIDLSQEQIPVPGCFLSTAQTGSGNSASLSLFALSSHFNLSVYFVSSRKDCVGEMHTKNSALRIILKLYRLCIGEAWTFLANLGSLPWCHIGIFSAMHSSLSLLFI